LAWISLPYIAYLLAGFIGLAIIRSFKTKEMLQYLCGVLVPFMLYGSWTFYKGVFQEKMVALSDNKFGFPSDLIPSDNRGYIYIGLILLIVFISIFSYGNYSMKKSIQVQKKIDILFWMIASAMIALFINDNLTADHLLMLAIPLGILLSMNLLKINSPILPELIHLGILILIGVLHLMQLLHILLLSLTGLGLSSNNSTLPDPIKWTFTIEQAADGGYDLVATADIKKGWYLYSQDNTDEGPVPTSFTFNETTGNTLKDEVSEEGDIIKKHDELFEMVISKYKDKVIFKQRFETDNAQASISGYVTFMTCDGLRCLPPKDVEFNVSLK